ncbi:hypothetical protein A5753_21360 [Mycobacterium sp. 852002-51971_SCH5477799-a]|nr:hypothetical protein A5753_21360 [Mycobacterium sp. 852002-51971_SCH5477799-a]
MHFEQLREVFIIGVKIRNAVTKSHVIYFLSFFPVRYWNIYCVVVQTLAGCVHRVRLGHIAFRSYRRT